MIAAHKLGVRNRTVVPYFRRTNVQFRGGNPGQTQCCRRNVITKADLSRRETLLSTALVLGTASASTPASAAVRPFCGVTNDVPSWAFTVPWEENAVDSNGLKVWTRVIGKTPGGLFGFGQRKEDARKKPLLVVHGGPGLSSQYMESLELLCYVDRRVAFYDQAGCGKSRIVSDGQAPDPSSLSLKMYLDELHTVRKAFDFREYHLMGHGWGGIVALSYLLSGQMDGVLSLTLVSTPATYQSWIADRQKNAKTLGDAACDALLRDDGSVAYQKAFQEYHRQFITRRSDAPDCLSLAEEARFQPALQALCGGYTFQVAGTLSDWDPSGQLGSLKGLPTLIIRGDHDEVSLENAQQLAVGIPGAQLTTFENSGSCVHIDNHEMFLERLHDHLTTAELGA